MTTKPAAPFIILCDTREQKPPPFPEGVVLERRKLDEADYTTPALIKVARIERKGASDFASTLTWGRERFDREVARLRPYRHKCVIVEADLSEIYREYSVHPHAILGSIASFYARANMATFFAVNAAGCGRLIAGILRRLEEEVAKTATEGSTA
ncbi:MAG: hypothetical protein M3O46_21460 [Myxococcota bacterium]|nr:hypothetical protein [Myxococcota bacterium]